MSRQSGFLPVCAAVLFSRISKSRPKSAGAIAMIWLNSFTGIEASISAERRLSPVFSIPRQCRGGRLLGFATVVLFLALGLIQAQSIQYTQNKPDQALRSAMRVDPSTLGLSIEVPISGYPG